MKRVILCLVALIMMGGIVMGSVEAAVSPRQYAIYGSKGGFKAYSTSLFDAIDQAVQEGQGSMVKIRNREDVLFLYDGKEDTLYGYLGSAYVGKMSTEEAEKFIAENKGAHVLNGLGQNVSNSYTMFRGQPDPWAIEPSAGGYHYKFGYVFNNYRKVSVRVNLTKLRMKHSQTNQKHNAYAYISSQNSKITLDAGLYSGWAHNGEWRVFTGLNEFKDQGVIVSAKLVDGEYIPESDVLMTYEYTEGKVTLTIEAVETGKKIVKELVDERIGGNMALLSGTSYVTDIPQGRPVDIRTGGYLKNIEYQDFKIYDINGNVYDFWADSETVNYSLLYTDDCVEMTHEGTGADRKEIVNILYDQPAEILEESESESKESSSVETDSGVETPVKKSYGWLYAVAGVSVVAAGVAAYFAFFKKRKS